MKTNFIVMFLVVFELTACANQPPIQYYAPPTHQSVPEEQLVHSGEISHMSRQDVINAVGECTESNMKPNVINARVWYGGVSLSVPVDVQCTIKHADVSGTSYPPPPDYNPYGSRAAPQIINVIRHKNVIQNIYPARPPKPIQHQNVLPSSYDNEDQVSEDPDKANAGIPPPLP